MANFCGEEFEYLTAVWRGDNLKEVIDLVGLHHSMHHLTWEEYEDFVAKAGLKVRDYSGRFQQVKVGDCVILREDGEIFLMRLEAFSEVFQMLKPKSDALLRHKRRLRFADEYYCPACGKRWGVDDPEPPPCD